jgi:broad specificity phosphatase PhoE
MLTLFFSPHMTSVDNEAGRASGHADVPLSVHGQQRAQELGQHYATEALDAIFCSDLQHASSTAQTCTISPIKWSCTTRLSMPRG